MARVKRSVAARKKRRKVLQQASGYWGTKTSSYKRAKEQVNRSLNYAYRDRKVRKRDFRRLWIVRINAAARENGLTYGQLIHGLHEDGVELNRKVLADLATHAAAAFAALCERVRAARGRATGAAGRSGRPHRFATRSCARFARWARSGSAATGACWSPRART